MNKYLDKHTFFIKHGLFYNNKKESIHPDFLPFTDDYQNKQYLYQKQMSSFNCFTNIIKENK